MTLGLCLLALAAVAQSGDAPALVRAPQGNPSNPQKQSPKGKTPAPKKIVYPSPKTPEAPAPTAPQPFRNLALTIGERVSLLADALKPEERAVFLCVSQKAIERLGIPAFDWSDRAPDTRFPHPIGIGASFDLDLASRIATLRALGSKGKALFAPIEVIGDPRWGSCGDTFGEDPLLVGSMAAAQVAEYRRAGCIGEVGVMGRSGRVSEPPGPSEVALSSHGLADLFLEPAKLAVAADSGLGLVVDPFARTPGSPLFTAKFLDGTVRKGWGLTGPVIAPELAAAGESSVPSAAATASPPPPPPVPPLRGTNHPGGSGTTPSEGSAVSAGSQTAGKLESPGGQHEPSQDEEATGPVSALLSGCDLFTEEDCKALVEAAKANPDVAKAMDRALHRVLETEMRAGLFDPPHVAASAARPAHELELLQARAAAESIVLLKNQDQLLPLKPGYKTVAVIGPDADNASAMLGAEPGASQKVVTPLEAIKTALGDKTKVLYQKGTGMLGREDLQTIPASAVPGGFNGEYYNSPNFSGTPVTKHEDILDLTWKNAPVEGVDAKSFSAIWTGAIVPTVSGKYGIGLTVDGAARLYLDDRLIIDDWHDGPTRTKTVGVELSANDPLNPFYVVRIEYARGAGNGSVRLVWSPPEEEPYRDAIEAAIKSDLVILVLGLDPSMEGPGHDRRDISLPDAQEGLLEQIAALQRPTVLVLLNGGPVSSPFAKDQIPAILEAWYPGEAGGAAIAGVLTGAVNPTGKLPVTIYQTSAQLPSPLMVDAPRGYQNSLYRPLFAFGSGLSYTHFAYSGLNAPAVVDGTKPVTVGVTVKNIGKRSGEEVVQLYLSRDAPTPDVPRIALRGFRRVQLNPGESRRVVFPLSVSDFSVGRPDLKRTLQSGAVRVSVGGNQPMDGLSPTVSATVRIKAPKL